MPTLSAIKTTRTLEGSLGVFVVSLGALVLGLYVTRGAALSVDAIAMVPAIAAACTVIEAISPHGWDNATMQLAPALFAAPLLS